MKKIFVKWRLSTEGVTAVEYGLIAAGLAVAISVFVFAFGENLAAMFTDSAAAVALRP